jgi:hypothetical protein
MAAKWESYVLIYVPNRTECILFVSRGGVERVGSARITEMRILLMAAKWGPNVLICVPNRTECILFVSRGGVQRLGSARMMKCGSY